MLSSGLSRPGHKVSGTPAGTRSKFPNLNENGPNLIFCEVFLTQNPVNILSRSATAEFYAQFYSFEKLMLKNVDFRMTSFCEQLRVTTSGFVLHM